MAVKTTIEQLEEVQTAISQVLQAQEVSRGGKTHRLAELNALQAREKLLLARYKREQGRGSRQNIGIPGRY